MKTFPQLKLDTGVDIGGMLVDVQYFDQKFIHFKKIFVCKSNFFYNYWNFHIALFKQCSTQFN